MTRRVGRELLVIAAFVALTIFYTWPQAIRLETTVSDLGDPLLNVWIVDWVCHSLLTDPLNMYDAPMYVPGKLPLAYSENLVGIALFALPFHAAGATPVAVYNLMMLLGFILSAYGAFVLVRLLVPSTIAAFLGGVLYAFVQYKWDHLAHLQIIWSGWIPLLLAALLVFWRKPTTRNAALLFGAFVMNGLTNVHWFLFGSFTLVLTVVFLATFDPRRGRAFWLRLIGALGLGGLVLLPFLIPYRVVADLYNMRRGLDEIAGGSARVFDWLIATGFSFALAPLTDLSLGKPERQLFPGIMMLVLAVSAAVLTRRREVVQAIATSTPTERRRLLRFLDVSIVILPILAYLTMIQERVAITAFGRQLLAVRGSDIPLTLLVIALFIRLTIRFPLALGGAEGRSLRTAMASSRFTVEQWAAALWIAIGFLGSMGLNTFFHSFLVRRVEIFRSVRAPARWVVVAYIGLAVWAAMGFVALTAERRRRAFAALLGALVLFECMPQIRWEHAEVEPAPVYRWLKREQPRGPVLELPMNIFGVPFRYLLSATEHRVPLVNGTSGFEPPLHRKLREKSEAFEMDEEFTTTLEATGCQLVNVHVEWLSQQGPSTLQWLQRELARGRLAFIRRFDHGVSGDYVFAVTRNLPDWQRLRGTLVAPDGAGNLPDENLARMFAGKPTYNSGIFGRMDHPKVWADVTGELKVWGWAMSPHGIERVTVLIEDGRYRYDTFLSERRDISALYPWYPKTDRPAFTAIIPKRPRGVPKDTEVQVEVEDGAGNVTRFPDIIFTWK